MLNKILFTGCLGLLLHSYAYAQNVLDGVYVRQINMQNADSSSIILKGMVVDRSSAAPLQDVSVRYTASNGQNIGVVTDENGMFSFTNLDDDPVKAKISCSHPKYKTSSREFSVSGSTDRRELNFNFELEKK